MSTDSNAGKQDPLHTVDASYRRFVYVHNDMTKKFPMHFGVEVIKLKYIYYI